MVRLVCRRGSWSDVAAAWNVRMGPGVRACVAGIVSRNVSSAVWALYLVE
jgi:hypothetical protein